MKLFIDPAFSVEEAASTFAALGSEQRLAVLQSLVRAGEKGLTMGQLGERTGVTGSTLTHHLKILVQANLIAQKKSGRSITCTVDYDQVRGISDYLLEECCADIGCEGHDHD